MAGKKKSAALLAAFCVLAAVLALVWWANRPDPTAGEKTITVEVVHKDGSEKSFSYDTDAEYLEEVLVAEGLVSGTESQYGLFVDTVDGETADYNADGSWWKLSCDGKDAETGAGGVAVQDGGVYTWTYTVG